MTSGYRKISKPEDLEKALTTMLNKILLSDDPISHAGRFSSLANAWINCHRLTLEAGEWAELRIRIDAIEQAQAFHSSQRSSDFKADMVEMREMMKAP